MPRARGIFGEFILGIVLLAVAFGCGWLAYGWHHNSNRTFTALPAASITPPPDHPRLTLAMRPQFTAFHRGDWVDVLVSDHHGLTPLVLNALVVEKTAGAVELWLPLGVNATVVWSAIIERRRVELRPSIAPRDPAFESAILRSQVKP